MAFSQSLHCFALFQSPTHLSTSFTNYTFNVRLQDWESGSCSWNSLWKNQSCNSGIIICWLLVLLSWMWHQSCNLPPFFQPEYATVFSYKGPTGFNYWHIQNVESMFLESFLPNETCFPELQLPWTCGGLTCWRFLRFLSVWLAGVGYWAWVCLSLFLNRILNSKIRCH